jgi:hypothetical protein
MQMNEDKPMFRVGGVYRQRNGVLARLGPDGLAVYLSDGHKYGPRSLFSGADLHTHFIGDFAGDRSLIPGELELRDGQWVPVEEKEEAQLDGAELIRRWAENERARLQMDRAERLLAASPNEAMVARDCTEAACLYAEQRQEAERVRAILSAPVSTALPPLRALTLSTDLEPASHQVRAAFGSASLKG